jgi:hypothetical protein
LSTGDLTVVLLRTSITALICALSLSTVTPGALAAPRGTTGSCPKPFEAFTVQELVAFAASAGVPAAAAEARFAEVNRNGDAFICVQTRFDASNPNLIDNNAR